MTKEKLEIVKKMVEELILLNENYDTLTRSTGRGSTVDIRVHALGDEGGGFLKLPGIDVPRLLMEAANKTIRERGEQLQAFLNGKQP